MVVTAVVGGSVVTAVVVGAVVTGAVVSGGAVVIGGGGGAVVTRWVVAARVVVWAVVVGAVVATVDELAVGSACVDAGAVVVVLPGATVGRLSPVGVCGPVVGGAEVSPLPLVIA